ncbi:MAG: methyltransferase [Rhodoferax sp.]|uniref:methyltransferase n=1 Tax=Rhodoferax sp. TaxID=50421 RepID=UPI00271D7321|nr:methyltransferase [Rhodoferax sp.]MDO8449711.1 methyltransferase [Rhodoferax sp.]
MGPSPDAILQLGSAFWASKTLLSAVELGVFTALGDGPLERSVLADRCGLHPRSAEDFLDALVALGMLTRDGARYANTPETDLFLDRKKPAYVGGLLEMFNARLYGFWGSLTDALKSGQPQNEARQGESFFGTLYSDPQRLQGFLAAMSGVSMGAARAIATRFPWRDYKSFVDVGCAQGALAVQVALAHPHLQGLGFDLPPVQASFNDYVQRHGLKERLTFRGGDFFHGALPHADVIVMGHVLHDWSLDEKKQLIAKAYDALPEGGALLVYEAMIDDERRSNAFGLLMSLNMLIETPAGFDFTGAQCCAWMKAAGFRETRVEHLIGPDSMVIGLK